MSMPHLMNCQHSPDGHCLECVSEAHAENAALKAQLREAVECLDYLFVSTNNDWIQTSNDNEMHDRIVNCLALNADIVKELEQ